MAGAIEERNLIAENNMILAVKLNYLLRLSFFS